jgi:hypothetical protein
MLTGAMAISGVAKRSVKGTVFETSVSQEYSRKKKCVATQYADVVQFVGQGVWLLEGSLDSHKRYAELPTHVPTIERIRLAGGVWLDHRKHEGNK